MALCTRRHIRQKAMIVHPPEGQGLAPKVQTARVGVQDVNGALEELEAAGEGAFLGAELLPEGVAGQAPGVGEESAHDTVHEDYTQI